MNTFYLFMVVFILSFYALIAGFFMYAAVKPVWNKFETLEKIILFPFSVFYLVDVFFNFVFGTIIFLEPPRQLTFTARCSQYLDDNTWRGTRARIFCKRMNIVQPNHCHKS